MINDITATFSNKLWNDGSTPKVSVITPAYNNKLELKRAIDSICKQSYKNIEYIIINDGSPVSLDEVVFPFLNSVPFPMLYVKKKNGGAHTSYNRGIEFARGEYVVMLDCDDELVPNAIETLLSIWETIRFYPKKNYYQVVAQCKNENNERVGKPFDKRINSVSRRKSIKLLDKSRGEHVSMDLASIRKAFLSPEPEDVTYVSEDLTHKQLDKKYDSYFVNDMLRIYHTETSGSITKTNNLKTKQICYNTYWCCAYLVNNQKKYYLTFFQYIKTLVRYQVMGFITVKRNSPYKSISLRGFWNNFFALLLYVPVFIISKYYLSRRVRD